MNRFINWVALPIVVSFFATGCGFKTQKASQDHSTDDSRTQQSTATNHKGNGQLDDASSSSGGSDSR